MLHELVPRLVVPITGGRHWPLSSQITTISRSKALITPFRLRPRYPSALLRRIWTHVLRIESGHTWNQRTMSNLPINQLHIAVSSGTCRAYLPPGKLDKPTGVQRRICRRSAHLSRCLIVRGNPVLHPGPFPEHVDDYWFWKIGRSTMNL
jgi:hypothetical protein